MIYRHSCNTYSIKPLHWECNPSTGDWRARTVFGYLEIVKNTDTGEYNWRTTGLVIEQRSAAGIFASDKVVLEVAENWYKEWLKKGLETETD